MKPTQAIRELTALLESAGVRVRYDRGNFHGGPCTVRGQRFILLNRHHPPEVHLSLLLEAVQELPLEEMYIRPALRAYLENALRHAS